MNLKDYLKELTIIDFKNQEIQDLAKNLSKNCNSDEEIVKNCFLYVRDKISHSGDIKADITTCKASDVLKYRTGWCYAKSHLLAALLRANNIPTGFCYQRISYCNMYCLHGLNAVYLEKYGWYRIDARGNKKDVHAQFNPPIENLAFELKDYEYDLAQIYAKPLDVVINSLQFFKGFNQMSKNLPLTNEFIRRGKLKDAKDLNVLVTSLLPYIFEQTPSWFKEEISEKSFKDRLKNKNYKHYIYTIDEKIVGFLSIKEENKLFHLFVDEAFHKKGIAKKLFECVKTNMDITDMKVNASLYAVAFYEALGFEKSGKQEHFKGLDYQPLIYNK
ncbi:putative acetyltransferase/transglutaminase [Malaciobacter molluscorum LMG 25693]|uniref:Acetyltransferase/transglutaminase n=1 Tax=Malaciobacter molluscorum LMG 25693 TaxID=870501 RepID=A0AB33GMM0_9BACT|nr:GNAT family N-acetyltransferase [Malaciobacter molluscorum]AXX92258.1 putative acetyltransferase/transglutaminase [Malaciobacter molluscorum LMG 25693]